MATTKARHFAERLANECYCSSLRMLQRHVSGLYDQAMGSLDVNIAHVNILAAIVVLGDSASPANVGRALVLEKSTLSREIPVLVKRGWVRQMRAGTGRGFRLGVTPEGSKVLERVQPAWERAQERAASFLLGHEQSALLGAAQRLRRVAFHSMS
jgi:DNA-binding MarR family transcriptional regulator